MPFTVFAAARPIRSAFLLTETGRTNVQCDSFVHWSLQRWGGRRSALALLKEDGALSDDAWQELAHFDPDQVHSFAPVSDGLLAKLDDSLAPWLVTGLDNRDKTEKKPVTDVATQSSNVGAPADWELTHVPLPGMAVPPTKPNLACLNNRPLFLPLFAKDCPVAIRRFIHRNFGAYEQWFDLRDGEPRLMGWMEDLLANQPLERQRVSDVASACAVMERIAGKPPGPNWKPPLTCTIPCELSSIHFGQPFSRGVFNFAYRVVVGSTIKDYILYWQSCLNEGDGAWDAPFRHCLWIPTELIQEETFVAALQNWLFVFTGQGSSGSRTVEVTSASLV